MPPAEAAYLAALAGRLRAGLGEGLVGVYLMGSGATGDDRPGSSDLDVWALTRAGPARAAARRLARAVCHAALPCPARRLELVVARLEGARPVVAVNLEDGPGAVRRAWTDPDRMPASHWFTLDLAIGRGRAIALWGPPAAAVMPPVPRSAQLAAVRRSLAWHDRHDPHGPGAVLAALRGARYALDGAWLSKREAVAWAEAERPCWAAEARAAWRALAS
jgi:hypothetical protein